MAVRAANIKGIKFLEEPQGADKGGVALITFDIASAAFTGGSDTIKLGAGGYDRGTATTDTLAVMIAKQRRDGKTVTLTGVAAASVAPGRQAAATGGPLLYVQSAAVNASANVDSIVLKTAATSGSDVTCAASAWEQAAAIAVTYIAS